MKDYTTVYGEGKEKIELVLLDEPMEQHLVGMVTSAMFKENIAIVVEDNPDTVEYDFACLAYAKGGTAPRIMMKNEFYEALKHGTAESVLIVFHELGHYCNGDILNNDGLDDKARERLAAEGKASEKETRADAFAAHYIGTDTAVQGLTALKNRTLNDFTDYDQESVQLSVKEINYRISKLK